MTNQDQLAQAISDSIHETRIVHLDACDFDDDFNILAELRDLADDSVNTGEIVEFWGTDSDGDEWRVHVHI